MKLDIKDKTATLKVNNSRKLVIENCLKEGPTEVKVDRHLIFLCTLGNLSAPLSAKDFKDLQDAISEEWQLSPEMY